ncbi:YheC/YheD family protein [Fodinisporobacter ferrooxydans]|uniref:YheC/YheD family protein n=1 Tax=Fodinisporobacter ferrooxydans TaxID=2901836 RepID=A0ABY4CEG1_9BACL|nr:YheC/YheD family protein [Alicyclobacillaceae bacterium MYW30-H2]
MEKVVRFAIVTTVMPKKQGANGVRRPSYGFRMMVSEAQRLGVQAYLVHPDQFDWKAKRMTGWTGSDIGTDKEKWFKQTVPLPDVVYDNVFVHLVVQGKTAKVRKMCKTFHIPLFNPICPGKFSVNHIMINTDAKQYIPKTKILRQGNDAIEMLHRFKTVYVKPSGGYGGQGVTRIEKLSTEGYRVKMDRNGGKVIDFHKMMSEKELLAWLNKKKYIPHVVQQGISLIQVDGGNVDFRVVVQRGKQGKWELIGIVPKIAKKGGVVTNLVAGGRKSTLHWLIDWSNRHGQPLSVHLLEHAAVEIANVWSKRLPTLGILGFDMGLDTHGNVWMIEMNPKPARSLLTSEMRKKSFRAVAEFAQYLGSK